MDNKYQFVKPQRPETKIEILQQKIEDLVRVRDREKDLAAKKKLNAEIMTLYAQFERLKL